MYVALAALAAAAPASPVVIEFYAPWCQVCQRFEPEFLKVASLYRDSVAFERVDCEADYVTCDLWSIDAYPTVVMIDSKVEGSTYETYDGTLSAQGLESWIVNSIRLDQTPNPPGVIKPHGNWDDALSAINATLKQVKAPVPVIYSDHLRAFLAYVAEIAPEYKAMATIVNRGSILGELLPHATRPIYNDVWNHALSQAPDTLAAATKGVCDSSACATWTMLHALSVSGFSNLKALTAASHVVANTFPCKECAAEFNRSIYGLDDNVALDEVYCDEAAALWLHEVHNKVNVRLQPPKPVFPGSNCSKCATSATALLAYLQEAYHHEPVGTGPHSVVIATCALAGPLTIAAVKFAMSFAGSAP